MKILKGPPFQGPPQHFPYEYIMPFQPPRRTCSLRVSSQRGRCGTLGADQRPKSPLLGTTSTWRRQGSPQEILFKWKNHVKDSRKKSSPTKSESGHLFFPESLSRPKKQEGPRASNGDIFRKIQRHVSSAGVIGKYIFQSGSIIQPAMLVDPGVYVATWLLPSIFLESEALKIATPPSVAWHFVPRSRWHFPWPGEVFFLVGNSSPGLGLNKNPPFYSSRWSSIFFLKQKSVPGNSVRKYELWEPECDQQIMSPETKIPVLLIGSCRDPRFCMLSRSNHGVMAHMTMLLLEFHGCSVAISCHFGFGKTGRNIASQCPGRWFSFSGGVFSGSMFISTGVEIELHLFIFSDWPL